MTSLIKRYPAAAKAGMIFILATFVLGSFPITSLAHGYSHDGDGDDYHHTALTVDIKANGSDGPVTINSGDTYTYAWTSTGAVSCQQTSPVNSGIPTSGNSAIIGPGDPFYPASATSPAILTVTCTDGSATVSDSVTINLTAPVEPPATTTPPVATSTPTVDVKANGSDGPVALNNGDTYTYTWTSEHTTSCQITSPVNSGIPTAGTSAIIGAGSEFYPSAATPAIITIICTDGSTTASDSVTITLNSTTTPPVEPPATTTPPTVDVKANGSDGPITINSGDTYTYTWTSEHASTCQLVSPVTSGITLSGTSALIGPGSNFYPSTTTPVTIKVDCSNGTATATDSVLVNLVAATTTPPVEPPATTTPPTTGGGTPPVDQGIITSGGGGGLGLSGGRHPVSIVPACLFLHDYMRMDLVNDPNQVTLLQIFLKSMEGYDYVTINGVFDQATFNAVSEFQNKYKDDILTPWGINAPTGYVYILTLKKINEIYCQTIYPLSESQQNEIAAYKALIESLQNQGITPVLPGVGGTIPTIGGTTTSPTIPVVGQIIPTTPGKTLAAAIFSLPPTLMSFFQCLWELLLILVVLYILGSVLEDVLYTDLPENTRKRFNTKWITISTGLALALVVAWILKEYCLIVPLTLALLFSLIWIAIYPSRNSIRAWYIVTLARAKTMVKGTRTTQIEYPFEK